MELTIDLIKEWLKIILVFCASFLGSYFKTKGNNIANKQDLKELTRIVEKVKSEFQEDLENFKTELNANVYKKNLVFSEQKSVIDSFYSSYTKWSLDYSTRLDLFDTTSVEELYPSLF